MRQTARANLLGLFLIVTGSLRGEMFLGSGDVNDDGKINIADPICILDYLFTGGTPPADCGPCEDVPGLPPPWSSLRPSSAGRADVNADFKINIADAVFLLQYLFADGAPPAPCGRCWPCEPNILPATGFTGPCWGYGVDNEVDCDDSDWIGQDAQLQIGCKESGRFVDNHDGTITDLCTGLMWQKDVAEPVWDPLSGPAVNWEDALRYAEDLQLAGYDDWRLPNVFELYSLARGHSISQGQIDAHWPQVFGPIPHTGLETAHLGFFLTSTAPFIRVGYGMVTSPSEDPERLGLFRCVRGGTGECESKLPATGAFACFDPETFRAVPCDSPKALGQDGAYRIGCPMEGRFADNGDGTVTDLCTGLMWQKEAAFVPPEYEGDDCGMTSWQGALKYARDLRLAGFDDWRVPNIFEIFFLSNWGCAGVRRGCPEAPAGIEYPFDWAIDCQGRMLTDFWSSSVTDVQWLRAAAPGGDITIIQGAMHLHDGPSPEDAALVRCVRGPVWGEEQP